MQAPTPPANEPARLQSLRALDILDTLPEQTYDDIVALAARACEVPIALVSLVDERRQWFKARYGLDASETPRDVSFCGHVVQSSETLVVEDAHEDARFADNPLVVGGPRVRFYVGEPLRTPEGHVLGTLCVIDHVPRTLDAEQRAQLAALSRLVMSQLTLRAELLERERLEAKAARAEGEASKLRSRYERFFAISLDLLCICGMDGYFQELNPAWTKLLGYTLDEMKAVPFLELVHPDDREATALEAAKLATPGHETVSFENRYRAKNGDDVWLLWTAKGDLEAKTLIAAARDITDRKRAEDQLREARDLAETADRTKSQFLATMSHELRTPLNAIIGFSKILYKNKGGTHSERDLKFLARIRDNGTHLLGLINEVLDISKIEAGHMVYSDDACDIASTVDAVTRLQESLALEKSLELRVECPEKTERFRADQHRLRQVLINLVSNAIKFTASGRVTVRVVLRAGTLQVAAVEVEDTGEGIAPDALERVFVPFEQLDGRASRTHSGTGLGLAISRALCEGMGIGLTVESTLGEGSCFRLSIPPELSEATPPVSQDTHYNGGPSDADRARSANTGCRVLVIDDNADARQLLAEQLEELGCRVRCAPDGAEGLRIARAWTPELITLDIMMPAPNGWQVLAALRADERLREIPVVIISMIADESRGTLAGALDVMRKPIQREDLSRVLDALRSPRRRALLIEGDADLRRLLAQYLEAEGWEVAEATDVLEGLRGVGRFAPDLVFVDARTPLMGAEFLEKIRSTPAHRELPIVVITANELEASERDALLRRANEVLPNSASLRADLRQVLESQLPRDRRPPERSPG